MWPYLAPFTSVEQGQIIHGTTLLRKAKEISVNPLLTARLYCIIVGYPLWEEWSLQCTLGNNSMFKFNWAASPLEMLRDNIALSVLDAALAFFSLLFGILGKPHC